MSTISRLRYYKSFSISAFSLINWRQLALSFYIIILCSLTSSISELYLLSFSISSFSCCFYSSISSRCFYYYFSIFNYKALFSAAAYFSVFSRACPPKTSYYCIYYSFSSISLLSTSL